jgi:hypothetical protein
MKVAGRIMSTKNSNGTIRNRTGDLLVCSTVSQPTAPPRTPESTSNIKYIRDLYRDFIDFKKGYQPRANIVKDEKVDLVRESHRIVARWRNPFFSAVQCTWG